MEESQLKEVIEKGFKDLRAELDEKFGSIDAKFGSIDAKFGSIDGKFGSIDATFRAIHTKFDQIDNQLTDLGTGVKKAADEAHLAHVAIEGLRHDLGIFNEGETSPIETRVSALEVRVTSLESAPRKNSGTAAESRRGS